MGPDWIDIIKKVLDEEHINSSDFDLNHNIVLPSDRKLNKAGVLVGICFPRQSSHQFYLLKRAGHLKNHPGQIAFPEKNLNLKMVHL